MDNIPRFQCVGSGFDPWSGEQRPHMAAAWPKNFEKNTGHEIICISYSSKEDKKTLQIANDGRFRPLWGIFLETFPNTTGCFLGENC